jgi:general secretion pathway protein J
MKRAAGFTLVEILVALLILGIMTALGYGTYRQARISSERTEQSQARTREIEFGLRMLLQDLGQVAPRPIRETLGDGRKAALLGSPAAPVLVEMTRGGWSNTAGMQRGTLQRVSYRLDKTTLKRSYEPVLDPTLATVPIEDDLLTKVKSAKIRYLDGTHQWSDQWPPASSVIPLNWTLRPIAVEITIEFEDWGKIRRIAELAG